MSIKPLYTPEDYISYMDAVGLMNQLVEIRRRKGISQRALAERLHTSQGAVSALERMVFDTRFSRVLTYAQAIGVKITFKIEE